MDDVQSGRRPCRRARSEPASRSRPGRWARGGSIRRTGEPAAGRSKARALLGLPPTGRRSTLRRVARPPAPGRLGAPTTRCAGSPRSGERRLRGPSTGSGAPERRASAGSTRGDVSSSTTDRRPVQVVGIFQDVTARKQAEEQQRLLLDELNHRVKNTLATVQSIAAQTLRTTSEPAAVPGSVRGPAPGAVEDARPPDPQRLARRRSASLVEQELAPYRRDGDERVVIEGPASACRRARDQSRPRGARARHQRGEVRRALGSDRDMSRSTGDRARAEDGRAAALHLERKRRPAGREAETPGLRLAADRAQHRGRAGGYIVINFAPAGVSYDVSVPLPGK